VAKGDKLRLNSTDANTGVPGIILLIFAISFWTACNMCEVSYDMPMLPSHVFVAWFTKWHVPDLAELPLKVPSR